jgi:hypothetical protein
MRVIAIKANEREQCRSNSGDDYRGKPNGWIWKWQQDCKRKGSERGATISSHEWKPRLIPPTGQECDHCS